MNTLEALEAQVREFDAKAEAASWAGHNRMAQMYHLLAQAANRLAWTCWAEPGRATAAAKRSMHDVRTEF